MESKLEINDNSLKNYLSEKFYHNHCDIDLWINITIIQLLNYDKLLGKDLVQLIHENKKYNNIENEELINKEKIDILKKISEGSGGNNEKSKIGQKNSILDFDFPEFEFFFNKIVCR